MWYNCGFLSFDLQATRTEGSIQSGRLLSKCSILALPPKSLLFLQLDWVLAQAILNSYLFSPYVSINAVYLAICTFSPQQMVTACPLRWRQPQCLPSAQKL